MDSRSSGMAVGVVDYARFNYARHNVGAGSTSWGYSGSSGKKGGGGEAWSPYGQPFQSGEMMHLRLWTLRLEIALFINTANSTESQYRGTHVLLCLHTITYTRRYLRFRR